MSESPRNGALRKVFRPELAPAYDPPPPAEPPARAAFAPVIREAASGGDKPAPSQRVLPPGPEAEPPATTPATPQVFAPELREAAVGEDKQSPPQEGLLPKPEAATRTEPGGLAWVWVPLGLLMLLAALALEWIISLAPGRPILAAVAAAGLGLVSLGLGRTAWREWCALRALGEGDAARAAVAAVRSNHVDLRRELNTSAERLAQKRLVPQVAVTEWYSVAATCDTAEAVEAEFSRLLLRSLDERAAKAVAEAATTTSVAVTLSPSAAGDLALFSWGALRLLRRVAAIYGLRPGRAAELKLLRRVLTDASLLALTDIAADLASAIAGRLVGVIAGRAAEGGLAAQRMARFGLLAMSACRPVPFDPRDAPRLRDVMAAMLSPAATVADTRN